LVAADLIEEGALEQARDRRYEGWDGALGAEILGGTTGLGDLEKLIDSGNIDPSPVSGQQERLESVINRAIWRRN
jgi:xylose isomerase